MLAAIGNGRPLLIELAFEALEPRGEITVGGCPFRPAPVPRIVAVHGEPRALTRTGSAWTPPEAAETLGPGPGGVKNKAASAKLLYAQVHLLLRRRPPRTGASSNGLQEPLCGLKIDGDDLRDAALGHDDAEQPVHARLSASCRKPLRQLWRS